MYHFGIVFGFSEMNIFLIYFKRKHSYEKAEK